MRNFWLLISVLWLWTCSGGGGSSPTEPQEPAPVSNFTATPTTLIQGQSVTFTSTSTGTITSYAWNVDADPEIEGVTSTYTHTYSDFGTYSVVLTVTGPGGSNSKTVADMIIVSSAAPTPTTVTTQTTQEDESTTISLTATDPNGQAVTFAITSDPTNGTATLSGAEITYTPNANFYGTDSFDYTASNGTYTSDPVTITITVEGEDDGNPTTNDVSATTDEDTVVTVNLDATEIDGDNYSFSIISQPSNGTLGSINGNQVEYTPNQDWNGTDTFTFEATDDRTSRRNVATATITVNAVNDAPTTEDVSITIDENRTASRSTGITLQGSDVDGNNLTYTVVSGPSNGNASIAGSILTYAANQDWNGTETITYKANDGTVDSNTSTVTITINSINDAPVTQNVSFTTDEDTPYTESYTSYVSDVEGDNLTITAVTNPTNGTAACDGTDCTYTPNQDFNGTDSFTYKVNDGELDSNVSTVTVTVTAVNDAPVANDMTATMDENKIAGRYQPVTIFLNATDVDGDDLTYSVVGSPTNGTLGSINGNQIIYTPTQDYNGEDTFTYKANDGTVDSNTATVTITINSVNDAPVAEDITVSTNEDTPKSITLQDAVSDVDGDVLKAWRIIVTQTNGSTSGVGTGGIITYTPPANFNGTDTFQYRVIDPAGLESNTATVTITVAAVNDAPVTSDQTASTDEDTAVDITLSSTDVEGDSVTYSIVSDVSNGSTSLSGSTVTYTPTANYNGTDTFTFKANDGTDDSNTSTVTITVAAVNDVTTLTNKSVTIAEDVASANVQSIEVGSQLDIDGDTLTYIIVSNPSNGSVGSFANTSGAKTIKYLPNANFNGTDTFTFKANDGTADSNTATVTITVTAVNDAPVANDVSTTIDENRFARMADLALDATDVEGDALTYILVSNPSNGTASISGSTLTYNANQDWNGTETFTYKANDGTADSNTATITITVNAINDTPVVVGTDEKNSKSIDFDGGTGSYLGVTGSPGINENVGVFTTAMTVHAWVKADQLENNKYIIAKGNAQSSGQRAYSLRSPNATGSNANKWEAALTTEYTTDGGGLNSIEYQLYSTSDASLTEWTHLAMTFDGSDIKFYINGSLETTQSVTGNDINNPQIHPNAADEDFRIGDMAGSGDYNFDGKIDAPAIWNTALSSSQISNLYNSGNGLSPTEVATSNLQGYWNFEDNLNDLTSNDNNLGSSGGLSYVSDVPGQYNTPVTASTNEDILSLEISLVGTDVDGDNLTYSIVTNPSNGTVSISGSTATYIPSSNYNGNDSFVYKANDGTVDSANRTVFIEIAAVNDVPTTSAVSVSTNEDTAKAITLVGADVDTGDTLTYSIVSNPSNGSLGSISGSSVTYTPTANWNGTDTFTYKANDGTVDSNTSTVTVTVAAVNDAPIASNFEVNTEEDLAMNFTFNYTDPDGDENLTINITNNPSNGSLSQNTLTEYRYTPNTNFSGTDSFKYTVSDGSLSSSEATVTLKVSNPFYEIPFDSNTQALSVLNKGSYIIIGNSDGGAKKYDSDMNEIWAINDNNVNNPYRIREHSDGSLFLLNSSTIGKYSSNGTFEWKADLNMDLARDFILVDDGIIIGGHKSIDTWNSYLATEKLSYSDGSSLWTKEHTAYSSSDWKTYHQSATLLQSSSGDIFFASSNYLMKFTSSQPIPSWVESIGVVLNNNISMSSNDEIVVLRDSSTRWYYELYDFSGNKTYSQQLDLGAWHSNGSLKMILSAAISNDGNIYGISYDGDWGGLEIVSFDGSNTTIFQRIELIEDEEIGTYSNGPMWPASVDKDSETVIHIFNFKSNRFNDDNRVPLMIKTDLNGNILIP